MPELADHYTRISYKTCTEYLYVGNANIWTRKVLSWANRYGEVYAEDVGCY